MIQKFCCTCDKFRGCELRKDGNVPDCTFWVMHDTDRMAQESCQHKINKHYQTIREGLTRVV